MPKVSVVMSTYNGHEYIKEQLQSLKNQTYTIDEVIISDDASTDNTVSIIKEFIKKNNLKNWKLIENLKNRGWRINFKDTLKKAKGDYIFPCDQDDIWHKDKIEKMTLIMSKKPNIKLLVSNYTPIYEKGGTKLKLSKDLEDNNETIEQLNFSVQNFYVKRPGCVYCFRKDLLKYFKYSRYDDPHDAFLWRISLLLDGLYLWHYSTIDFRRHANNATARARKNLSSKKETVEFYARTLRMMNEFVQQESVSNYNEKKDILSNLTIWNNLRINVIEKRSIMSWLKLFKYRNYFWNKKTYFADILMTFNLI